MTVMMFEVSLIGASMIISLAAWIIPALFIEIVT
jgi:hypothetical protein